MALIRGVAQAKRLVLVLLAAMMPKSVEAAEAAGDQVRGELAFQYCYSCHTVDPNEQATLQGRSLNAIVGKRIAAQKGFKYSPGLRAFAERHIVWSEDLLDRYIASPESVIPKTTMNFGGMEDPQERADLIAFLRAQAR